MASGQPTHVEPAGPVTTLTAETAGLAEIGLLLLAEGRQYLVIAINRRAYNPLDGPS